MSRARLFVAVNLPAAEATRLHDALARLRAAPLPLRWLEPATYHLTLAFLGSVEDAREPELAAVLARVAQRHAPFRFSIGGVGAFPNLRRPRVVWMGVSDAAPLLALQDDVARALEPLGFPREAREWSPHLTLARARDRARPAQLGSLEASVNDVVYEAAVDVERIDLMQSHLRREGAQYERRVAAPLSAARTAGT